MLRLHELLEDLRSNDQARAVPAAFELAKLDPRTVVPVVRGALLEALGSERAAIRDAAAYAIGEFKLDEAREQLLKLVKSPETAGQRGSYMYALMHINCADVLLAFIDPLFDKYYEVRIKAYIIIEQSLYKVDTVTLKDFLWRLDDEVRTLNSTNDEADEVDAIIRDELERRMTPPP